MIKIKDNVELKELEKYGFERQNIVGVSYYYYDLHDNRTYISIGCDDRIIGIPTSLTGDIPSAYIHNLNILYDLIKADMVEKI